MMEEDSLRLYWLFMVVEASLRGSNRHHVRQSREDFWKMK